MPPTAADHGLATAAHDAGEPPDTGYDPNVEYKPPRSKGKILLGLLVLVALLVGGFFVAKQLTKDEEYAVPALANVEQAVAQNEVAKYDWKVTVQTERTGEVAAGNVIRTVPAVGCSPPCFA